MEDLAYRRQVDAQIQQYAERSLHTLPESWCWLDRRFLAPRLQQVFGYADSLDVYATRIADAVLRTGVDTAVSLGAGDGAVEVQVVERAIELGLAPFRLICLELSPILIDRARAAVAGAGLADRISVIEADLNETLPVQRPVAAFMANQFLHHVVALERLFDDVADRLHPQGRFVTFDTIGRNGHMRWPETLGLTRELWTLLPERLKRNHMLGRTDYWFENWDCSTEGFEGVRVQDILPLLLSRFDFEAFYAWGGLTDVLVSRGFGPNYDVTRADDRALLERVQQLQDTLINGDRIKPTFMAAVMSLRGQRPADGACACFGALTPEFAVRGRDLQIRTHIPPLRELGFESPYPPPVIPAPPAIQVGETVWFGARGNGPSLLRWGWAEPETDFTWAQGIESALRFSAQEVDAVGGIVVQTIGYFPPESEAQHVVVSLNGTEIGTIVHTRAAPVATTELRLKKPALGNGESLLVFQTERPRRRDLDGGDDGRPLAFALVSLRLTSSQRLNSD